MDLDKTLSMKGKTFSALNGLTNHIRIPTSLPKARRLWEASVVSIKTGIAARCGNFRTSLSIAMPSISAYPNAIGILGGSFIDATMRKVSKVE